MPKSGRSHSKPGEAAHAAHAMPAVAAPALLSFLKQVSSEASWDGKRIARVLNVEAGDVSLVAETLQMLGYAEPAPGKNQAWRTTAAGNRVSGARTPRFKRESVHVALDQLRARVSEMNADPASQFLVTDLVAFGDFLDEREKVQAADVGVGLSRKARTAADAATAVEHKREEEVMADLKAKSALLQLHPIEDWMRKRSHTDLFVEGKRDR